MGTWGEGPLENDTAADWAAETSASPTAISKAIHVICQTDPDSYLEVDEGCACVAACQFLIESLRPTIPGLMERLLRRKPTTPRKQDALVSSAIQAIDRILGENSELAELWDEAQPNNWRQSMLSMRSELASGLTES